MARRKVKNREESPWEKCLQDQFQTVVAVLATDCAKKRFFSAQSESSRPWSRLVCSYTQSTYLRSGNLRNHDEVHDDNFC